MSVMNKPDYKIFAQDAKSGECVAFPDILRGWGITLDQYNGFPPMELFNSAAKRIDEWLMYLTQRGLPEWDAAVDYPKDAMIQHAGVYYVSLKVTKGEQPNNSQASWKKLTEALGVDGKLDKSAVVQTTGISATDVMSQKAVSQALNGKASVFDLDGKIDNTSVVQEAGISSSLIMSQKAVTENTIPVGTVIFVSHDQNVTGRFLKTHGTAVSRTVYADLFAAIGTTYGTGDGSTTFNLPDTREEFPRFTGGGRAAGSKQSDATRNFNGSVSGRTATSTGRIFARDATGVFGTSDTNGSMLDSGSVTSPLPSDRLTTLTIDLSRQLPTANEFRPRNIAFAGWIKY